MISASAVKELREKTGVGMMDCKNALVEADGDMEKAAEILREKGLAKSIKKSGRIAAEGIVYAMSTDNVGVMVEVNSETDFAAQNAQFRAFAEDVAKTIANENPADTETLLACKLAGSDRSVQENLQDKIFTIGENLKVRRFVRVEGVTMTYVHGTGTVGVLVKFATEAAQDERFIAAAKDVAMQIAAMNPEYLDDKSVPEDVIAKEKEILKIQLAEDEANKKKPENVLDKIVLGRIGKFYKENCLLEQTFVKENTLSVKQYLASVAKEIGKPIEVLEFFRYQKGEGLEKREDDFVKEVMSQISK